MVNEKILPHFHIPLQSGSDKILGLMRRRYTSDLFLDRVKRVREKIPFAGIGADVIVGFPGETTSDFEDTYPFLDEITILLSSCFHFFRKTRYCCRKTYLIKFLTEKKKKEAKSLSLFQKIKTLEFNKMNIGQITNVLFERNTTEGFISPDLHQII